MNRARRRVLLASSLVVGGCSGDGLTPPPGFESPGPFAVVDLRPGEFATFDVSASGGSIAIPAAPGSRSYLVVVHDGRGTSGGPIEVGFDVRRVPSVGAFDVTARSIRRAMGRRPGVTDPFERWFAQGEATFRRRTADELRRVGARPAARGRPGIRARASVVAATPMVGQLLDFSSPVEADGSLATCSSTSRVTGRVRALGPHFALVEDTLVAGLLSQSDYANILTQIETVVFPVDSAYFGVPHDLDGNGRVLALITGEVNRLGAAGFFTSADLASADDCPASNEGEVLWLVAPDPTRQFGFEPIPVDLVKTRLAGVIAHELQHLIHAERRIFEAGGDFESIDELWINEGLSHIAEEVSGLFDAGLRTGANLALDDLATAPTRERFSRYHLSDFRFVRDYLAHTGSVPLLVDDAVTRGQFRSARGFGYLFLRWMADQYAREGAPGLVGTVEEEALFRDLTIGGSTLRRSTGNVLGALAQLGENRSWGAVFADYVGVPAVDDVADADIPLDGRLKLSTWNLPQAYANARDNGFELDFPAGFPLTPKLVLLRTIPSTGFSDQFELLPTTAVYFRLEGVFETPLSRITLTGSDGGSLPTGNEIRITIVRTL